MISGLLTVVTMSAILGVASFGIGMLPLSFTFSRATLAKLSTFGTGLLLGAALGVIIPEGVETIATTGSTDHFPTKTIALSLLSGFKFMLLVERLLSRHSSHSHPHTHSPLPTSDPNPSRSPPHTPRPSSAGGNGRVEFDVELGELEMAEGIAAEPVASSSSHRQYDIDHEVHADSGESKKRAYPVTLGLIIHALADGLALGSSALTSDSSTPSSLSVIVFLALIIHKAPVAVALSTSLLSTSLSRSDCRKHLAVFSASTPIGALVTFGVMSLLGFQGNSRWSGIALLFSGGTFLYVATVLQPGRASSEDIGARTQFLLTILGMLVPVGISSFFGDFH